MAESMQQFIIPPEVERLLLSELASGWDSLKKILNPHVWAWFETHKDERVGTVAWIMPVYWGSFDLVKGALLAIFGPPSVSDNSAS